MKNILNIVSGINGGASNSNKLADAIVAKLQSVYPEHSIHTVDLTKTPMPHLEALHYGAFSLPADQHTEDQQQAIQHSDNAIKELKDADIIIIGVPFYNFGIPATLKGWIDQISRAGQTFSYADGTPKGLLLNKKVYLAIASGGVYSEGPMKGYDFAEPYLRALLGFFGLTDVTTFRIEGVAIPGNKEAAVEKGLTAVNEFEF